MIAVMFLACVVAIQMTILVLHVARRGTPLGYWLTLVLPVLALGMFFLQSHIDHSAIRDLFSREEFGLLEKRTRIAERNNFWLYYLTLSSLACSAACHGTVLLRKPTWGHALSLLTLVLVLLLWILLRYFFRIPARV
jgi:hypothetical protein